MAEVQKSTSSSSLAEVVDRILDKGIVIDAWAKVSLVGAGMKTHPGVAAQMFKALADAGVNLDMISTSSIRISCVISADEVVQAVRALHASFGLDSDEISAETSPGACGEVS